MGISLVLPKNQKSTRERMKSIKLKHNDLENSNSGGSGSSSGSGGEGGNIPRNMSDLLSPSDPNSNGDSNGNDKDHEFPSELISKLIERELIEALDTLEMKK